MLKHFVVAIESRDVQGMFESRYHTEVFEVEERDPFGVEIPNGAYAFYFYDQNVVTCEDGEEIYGEMKNISGKYFYGEGPFTEEEMFANFGDRYNDAIMGIKEFRFYRKYWGDEPSEFERSMRFVISTDGELHYLEPRDTVLYTSVDCY